MCAVLQNYTTISGFDKGVCSACTSREKVPPMLMEYMKLMHLVLSMYMGLDKEQMYGGEAVTACSKFLQFSGH